MVARPAGRLQCAGMRNQREDAMPHLTRLDVACALDLLARLEHVGGEPRAFVHAALDALGQFVVAEGLGGNDPRMAQGRARDANPAMQFRRLYWTACAAAGTTGAAFEPAPLLTRREGDVMQWLACGKTDAEIGALLAISPRTVHKHLQHVYEKLGVETRTAAVMALQRRAAT